MAPRFIPLKAPPGGGGGGASSPTDIYKILQGLAPAGTLAKAAGGLSGDPTLGGVGTGLAGLLTLGRGVAGGDPGQAIGGAANLGSGIASLAGYPGISSGLGAIGGPLTFATGLAKGDPLSATLGGVQTASLASGLLGGPTISSLAAPALNAAYMALPGATAEGLAGLSGAASGGLGSLWLANPATVMGGMMLMGGLSGMAKDAEMSERAFAESRAALGKITNQMGRANRLGADAFTGERLPGTLDLLGDTLQDAPNLGLFANVGTLDMPAEQGEQSNAAIQRMRAGAGQNWLRGLDAANTQGIDLTGEGGALRSPFRVGQQGEPVTLDMNTGINQDMNINLRQMAHVLDLTEAEAQQLRDAMGTEGQSWGSILEQASGANPTNFSGIYGKAFGPDRLPILKERGLVTETGGFDPATLNKVMDDQWLTSTVHDAVYDVGRAKGMTDEQLAQAGVDPGAWQTLAGGNVYGGGVNAGSVQVGGGDLPSMDRMARFPGAGTGLAGLLTEARGILGDDYGLGSGLNAPVEGRNMWSGVYDDYYGRAFTPPRNPWNDDVGGL